MSPGKPEHRKRPCGQKRSKSSSLTRAPCQASTACVLGTAGRPPQPLCRTATPRPILQIRDGDHTHTGARECGRPRSHGWQFPPRCLCPPPPTPHHDTVGWESPGGLVVAKILKYSPSHWYLTSATGLLMPPPPTLPGSPSEPPDPLMETINRGGLWTCFQAS